MTRPSGTTSGFGRVDLLSFHTSLPTRTTTQRAGGDSGERVTFLRGVGARRGHRVGMVCIVRRRGVRRVAVAMHRGGSCCPLTVGLFGIVRRGVRVRSLEDELGKRRQRASFMPTRIWLALRILSRLAFTIRPTCDAEPKCSCAMRVRLSPDLTVTVRTARVRVTTQLSWLRPHWPHCSCSLFHRSSLPCDHAVGNQQANAFTDVVTCQQAVFVFVGDQLSTCRHHRSTAARLPKAFRLP